MADASYIKSLFSGTPDAVKRAAEQAFTYLLGNLKLGPVDVNRRSLNFQWYWLQATTPSVAETEFTIAHGLGKVPSVILPVLPLDQVGAQMVPLTVSRAADANRVYLKSSATSAAITVLVE